MKKVLVVGLDGATLDLINKWIDRLPNFRNIMRNGVHGTLRSTIPPLSPTAWTSFSTGKNPGKTSVVGFYKRRKDSYEHKMVNSADSAQKTLWKILSDSGIRVGLLNVPMTYPPEPINGFIVPGIPAPLTRIHTYPPELEPKLRKLGYQIDVRGLNAKTPKQIMENIISITDVRAEVARQLMSEYDWDFFMAVFTAPDRIQHFFWRYMDPKSPRHESGEAQKYGDAIFEVYKKLDDIVGGLNKMNRKGITFIMSDHGHRKLERRFNLNDWLIRNGFLRVRGTKLYAKLFITVGLTGAGFWPRLLDKVGLSGTVKDLLPKGILGRIPWEKHPLLANVNIDWSKTKAYSFGEQEMIYINLFGREPSGAINLGTEYEELRNEIIHKLNLLRDEGKSLKVKVWKKEEIYEGKHFKDMPDLLLMIEDGSYNISTSIGHNSLFSAPVEWSGDHDLNGLLMITGDEIKRDYKVIANIMDLMPTILHIFNLPIPNDVDGRVLKEIFQRESDLAKRDITYQEFHVERKEYPWTKEEEEEIQQRLRELGYLF